MDRRRYPRQQYVPPGMVDFGQMDFGHDVVAQQMPGILQNYQQRWDMQDAAIAKLLEEQAGTQMLEGDAQAVGNLLKSSFDEIDTLVKDKYQGDRGAAAMDIVKRLSAARAPLAQARAEKERYDKAFEQYQQLATQGKAPRGNYDPVTGTFQTLGFTDFYKDTQRSAFDEKGRYVPREYQPLRGAGQHSEYIAKNYSKELQDRIISKVPQLANIEGIGNMIKSGQLRGITDEEVNKLFFSNGELTDEGRAYVQDFKANSTFAEQEFGEAFKDDKAIGEFIANTVKAQTVGSIVDNYSQYSSGESTDADLNSYRTFSGVEVTVPKENMAQAKEFIKTTSSGVGGGIARGLIKSAVLTADPLYRKKASYNALAKVATSLFINPNSIIGASLKAFPEAYADLMLKTVEINELYSATGGTEGRVEKGIEKLQAEGNSAQRNFASLADIEMDTTNPVIQASSRRYALAEDAPKYVKRERAKDYIKEFSTMSVSPKINVRYSNKKDLDQLKAEDEFWFGRNANDEPVFKASMANNAVFIKGESGEPVGGAAFINEVEDRPVQAYGTYSNDNPFGVGAKQVIVEGKNGPDIYAMIPTEDPNPIDLVEWQIHNVKYLPEQEIEIVTPFGNNLQIRNISSGDKFLTNPEYEVIVDGTRVNQTFRSTGDIFIKYMQALQ
jgi:hypothetical protein